MAEAAVNTTRQSAGAQAPDLTVFIGRFEPEHIGHDAVIREGLRRARRMVIVVGSAGGPRSLRNPFTADERIRLLRQGFADEPGLAVAAVEDSDYNTNDWLERVQGAVSVAWNDWRRQNLALPENPRVALIGYAKDSTSYYQKLFPQWDSIDVPFVNRLSATDIRRALFGASLPIQWPGEGNRQRLEAVLLDHFASARKNARAFLAQQRKAEGDARACSDCVLDFLAGFIEDERAGDDGKTAYRTLCDEQAFVKHYHDIWAAAPYPPIHHTGDAVVVQSGHILMVKRRNYPGRGLWALPGGFVEQGEAVLDTALRELIEETGIDMREKILRKNIFASEMFDAPYRSSRGRTITTAFLIHLDPGPLPRLARQREEVDGVRWIPLFALTREQCFEDHYAIIRNLTARLPG